MSSSYDEVLYPGFPMAHAHPDRLAAHAIVFGLSPAPVDGCRVLELGCGDGGHLIPIAAYYPKTTAVGVDLGRSGIEYAREKAARAGLSNVRFEQMNVMDIGADFGEFDFIIAHGLYSWVPPVVQEHILEILRTNLSPNGVGYISYNALPGCHIRAITRDMIRFRGGSMEDSRAFMDVLAEHCGGSEVYQAVIASEAQRLREMGDHSVFHDDRSEEYHPVLFTDFIAAARRHGLQYVAEADYFLRPRPANNAACELFEDLADGDELKMEQFIDFQRGRPFRQTLLCRAEAPLRRPPDPAAMRRLYYSAAAIPESANPRLNDMTVEKFKAVGGNGVASIQNPLGKTALWRIHEARPAAVAYSDLIDPEVDDSSLPPLLMELGVPVLLGVHATALPCTGKVSDRPRTSALVRAEIAAGQPYVSSMRHHAMKIGGGPARRLLALCDGSRTLQDIAAQLTLEFEKEISSEEVRGRVQEIARMGLIEA